MGKVAKKGKSKRADIARDDHLLNELADLLLENDSATFREFYEGRIPEICEEIMLRYSERSNRGMSHPVPKFSSREKLFKVTKEFGLDLFPDVSKETFSAWDLPYSHKYANIDDTEDEREGKNPYTEHIAKAEVLAEDVLSILEIADSVEAYEISSASTILETMQICESCWDDKKYSGLSESIDDLAKASILSVDIFLSTALASLLESKKESEDDEGDVFLLEGDSILMSINAGRLAGRQASLIYEAHNLSKIEFDEMAAESMLGAFAACVLMILDYAPIDMEVLDEEETKHYMATKAHGYDLVATSSLGLLPDMAVESDIANLGLYRDGSLFSEDN